MTKRQNDKNMKKQPAAEHKEGEDLAENVGKRQNDKKMKRQKDKMTKTQKHKTMKRQKDNLRQSTRRERMLPRMPRQKYKKTK